MDLSAFYSQFRDETAENLRVLGDGLLALEKESGDRARLDAIFRAMHTIKGSARMLGLGQIGALAHAVEHLLGAMREGQHALSPALSDRMLRIGDAILELTNAAVEGRSLSIDSAALLGALEEATTPLASAALPQTPALPIPPAPPAPAATPAPAAATASAGARRQTVRVRVDRLDRLLNLVGELAVGRQMQASHLQTLSDIERLLSQQQRSLLSLEADLHTLRLSPREHEQLQGQLSDLRSLAARSGTLVEQQLAQVTTQNRRHDLLVDDLEQEVMAVRLVAIAAAFANLPRATRDLCQATGKEVDLVLSGEETEIDRKVLELLGDPLTHLLRNAIDHGIESPAEREQRGKPRRGQIRISADASGGSVQITISDDGRGIEPQRLRDSALRKGLIDAATAALLSDQEALEIVFMPGFSTAQLITDISGRGVGLDVVRTNISELAGQVQITSTPGQGTTITLLLPLTLVTTRVLLLEAQQQIYALPASSSHSIVWVSPEMLRSVEGQVIVQYDGQPTALIQLEQLLGGQGHLLGQGQRWPAVLIGAAQRPLALIVDRIIDEREVVVKPLGPLFEHYRQYSGATQLGDGRLVLLLNPAGLVARARGAGRARLAPQAVQRRRLLYAEDSFTTRELVRSILTSAGYDVTAAIDGQDALERLRDERFDLLVSDVEMPRLNGFQLTSSLRRELLISEMPVIIMTSLASDEHRRQGLEAGAQAYIVKGQFDQNNLLDTIRQLIGP